MQQEMLYAAHGCPSLNQLINLVDIRMRESAAGEN